MSAAHLGGGALVVLYLVGLAWLRPEVATDALVIGATLGVGFVVLGVVSLVGGRR